MNERFVVSLWANESELTACMRQKSKSEKFTPTMLAKNVFLGNQSQTLCVFKNFKILVNFTQKLSVFEFFMPLLGFVEKFKLAIPFKT